ncbi:hypothetical protein ACJX0J_039604 [Zea mays]
MSILEPQVNMFVGWLKQRFMFCDILLIKYGTNAVLGPVAIFWDIENCPVPCDRTKQSFDVSHLHLYVSEYGAVKLEPEELSNTSARVSLTCGVVSCMQKDDYTKEHVFTMDI